jgi:hypothetical protein
MINFEQKIRELESERDRVKAQYQAATKQARQTPDAVVEEKMSQQAEDLKQKWNELNEKIKLAKKGELVNELMPDEIRTIIRDIWKSKIHLIDYEIPEKTFRAIVTKLNDDSAALLLVQQSELKMARLYWQRVHEIMKGEGGMCNVIREHFSATDTLTSNEYTNRLVKRFGCDENSQHKLDAVIVKLLNHAQPGQVIPIIIECEEVNNEFLYWLANEFWKKLLTKLSSHWGVRIVCAVLVAEDVEDEFVLIPCQEIDEFSCENYFEIILHNWEKQQVGYWFKRHDVIAPLINLGIETENLKDFVTQLITKTYKRSDGTPYHIYNNLHGTTIDFVVERLQNVAI